MPQQTFFIISSQQCTRNVHASNFSANVTADCTGSEDIRPDIVNIAYFVLSLCVWFVMPILGMGWVEGICNPPKQWFYLPFFYIGKLISAYAASAFFVYIIVPGTDIFFGFTNLCCHASSKNSADFCSGTFAEDQANMPAAKLYEQIGEAVPQFSIAATFYLLNWHWLSQGDKLMGVVTMTLSAGSILMGLVRGCIVLYSKDTTFFELLRDGAI